MNDFDYMEKYGDEGYKLDGMSLEEEQAKIDREESISEIKKCIEKINKLMEEDFNKNLIIEEAETIIGILEEI